MHRNVFLSALVLSLLCRPVLAQTFAWVMNVHRTGNPSLVAHQLNRDGLAFVGDTCCTYHGVWEGFRWTADAGPTEWSGGWDTVSLWAISNGGAVIAGSYS